MKRFLLFIILLLSFSFAIDIYAKMEIVDLTSSVNSEYYQWKQGPEGNTIYPCYSGSTYITRKDGKSLVTAIASGETMQLSVEGLREGYYYVVLKAKISSYISEPVTVYYQVGEQDISTIKYYLKNEFMEVRIPLFYSDGSFTIGLDQNDAGNNMEAQIVSVEAIVDDEIPISSYKFTDHTSSLPTSYKDWTGARAACGVGSFIERDDESIADLAEYWEWGKPVEEKETVYMWNQLFDEPSYGLYTITLLVQSSTSNIGTDLKEGQMDVSYIKVESGNEVVIQPIPIHVNVTYLDYLQSFTINIVSEGEPIKVSLCANQSGIPWHVIQYYKVTSLTTDAYSSIEETMTDDNLTDAQFYQVSGQRIPSLQPGINIIRLKNGKIRKVLIK